MAGEQLIRIAELEIDPAQLDDYLTFLTEEIAASIALEPGVLMLHAVSLQTAPHHIRLLEVYASRAAYQAHIETPHFLHYKSATNTMVTALRLLDATPILLATK